MFEDTKCQIIEKSKPIYRCFMRQLHKIPNVNKESLKKNIKPILSCVSEKGQTELKLISTREPLYTPDKYLSLKDVNYAILKNKAEDSSKLVVFGDTQMCFHDNFKYSIQPNTKEMTIFRAAAEAKPFDIQLMMEFLHFNQMPRFVFINNVVNRWFSVFKWKYPNLKWTALWDKAGKRYDLVKDSKVTATLFTTTDESDEYSTVTLEAPEIFLSRDRFFSAYFIIRNFKIKDFAISAFQPDLINNMIDFMDAYKVPELFTVDKVMTFIPFKSCLSVFRK